MPETWWDHLGNWKNYGDSINHPSRKWLAEITENESLLNVGCGSGKEYENLGRIHKRLSDYRGYDSSHKFIEACQGKYPEAEFRIGNALSLPEQVGSWDTVLCRHILEHVSDWRRALREAFRIARRRVIIILWRSLSNHPERRTDRGEECYCWDFNRDEFWKEMNALTPDIDYFKITAGVPNFAFILWKNDVIFDLDDFCDNGTDGRGSRFEILQGLKTDLPNLKVTLFTIPGQSTAEFLRPIAELDWIELAVHGWLHESNTECRTWDAEQTRKALAKAEEMACFVKGFKAPGWVINPNVCKVLEERDYWLAHHVDHRNEIGPYKPKIYWSHHPWMVHGHMQNIPANNVLLQNGLEQLCKRGAPFHEKTRFHLISEFLQR